MNDKDRIWLAEAMGWTDIRCMTHDFPEKSWNDDRCHKFNDHHYCGFPPGQDHFRENLPNPFTDANDDHAVLEWLRSKYSPLPQFVINNLPWTGQYRIGDYARAALKVLDKGEEK